MSSSEALPEPGWEQRQLEICLLKARELEDLVNSATDAATIVALHDDSLPEIDKNFPYFRQPVHISGRGIFPVFAEDGESIEGEGWGESEGEPVMHLGFAMIHDKSSDTRPFRVMQKVLIGEAHDKPLATVERHSKVYKYYELGASILPIIEMESVFSTYEFSEEELSQRLQLVNEYSRRFSHLVRSTPFRRMPHRRQQRLVDEFLLEAESQANLRDLQFTGEPAYAYAPVLGERQRHFIPMMLGDVVISGTCLGVDTLETGKLRTKAIRRDADMADKGAGLCVVVDPDDDTRQGLRLGEKQVLYIPTLDQTFDAVVYESH